MTVTVVSNQQESVHKQFDWLIIILFLVHLCFFQDFMGSCQEGEKDCPEGMPMPKISALLGKDGLPVSFTCGDTNIQTKMCNQEMPPMLWLWPLAPVLNPMGFVSAITQSLLHSYVLLCSQFCGSENLMRLAESLRYKRWVQTSTCTFFKCLAVFQPRNYATTSS
jgi:hypothetical protein